ncbi:tripartite motif-containing protein 2-like [Mytilus edulis]|uniref:tripartite motif-containing protein 2-like n=1 Tax=Mytilus edulis TaxID=6550 RepID=UPI0039F03B2B
MMASSAKHICTFCNESGISKAAVTWCIECEIFFCRECENPHRRSTHNTMPSQDYDELPKFVQEISSKCKDHKKTFELYCSSHDCPCCVQCVTNKHQKCQDMKPLLDFIKDVKVSESVRIYKQDLKDVNENLVKAIDYLNTRISTINTQKTEALEQIRFTRRSIDDYLNKIEQTILDDLDSKHSELKLNMDSFVKQMEQRLVKIEQIQSEYTKMTQYATNLQTYVALGEIAKTTSEAATYITGLKESGNLFSEKNLELNISPSIQSIEKDVKSFGDITINTNSSTLLIKTGRKNEALCIPKMDLIKTSRLKRLTIPKNMTFLDIRACLILPDGRVVILDYNKKQLLLFENDGFFIRAVVTFEGDPFDGCLVEKNTVAVLLGSANQTALVDVEKNTIFQRIELSHYSYGIASDGKNLIISSDGKNLGMSCESYQITKVNLHDMSQIILDGVKELNYIALFQGNIYGTNSSENTVCCYESTGKHVWTFKHQHIVKPGGLSLDNNGFVYLASQKKDSIVIVSPDGKTCKTILSEANGIKSPWAIDINRETRMMVVSSYISDDESNVFYEYDTAFVYKI